MVIVSTAPTLYVLGVNNTCLQYYYMIAVLASYVAYGGVCCPCTAATNNTATIRRVLDMLELTTNNVIIANAVTVTHQISSTLTLIVSVEQITDTFMGNYKSHRNALQHHQQCSDVM